MTLQVNAAGALPGIGVVGFLDGIVLHQIAQWHQTQQAQCSARSEPQPWMLSLMPYWRSAYQ